MPPRDTAVTLSQTRDALFAEVQRIARLGGFVWTPNGEQQWTDEFFTILGYAPGSVAPSSEAFYAAVHPDDVERVRGVWAAALAGTLEDSEYRVVHQVTGETRLVRGSGKVCRDAAGEVTQVIGAVHDITELKRSAVALEEALAIARAAERVAGMGSFVVRVEAMEMIWTEGLKVLTGVDDPNADAATHLESVHPDDREKQLRWWDRLVRERAVEPLSVRMVRPDGSVRHLYTQAAVMRLADGVERVIGTTLDVTERVQLEEQLRHAAKMEAIGTLAAGVAHDFNNYLLVMDSSLSMLTDSTDADEREELIDSGRLALSRCIELTRQLLAFARREPFRPEAVNLTSVVEKFHELLNRAVGRRALLSMQTLAGPLRARVDPRHIERMLTNLVVNAADAIEETGISGGRIVVRLEAATLVNVLRAVPDDLQPGDYVCVVVEDNGGGIDPARLPRIFDPYFTTKAQGRGTGLGLASVYGMARQNDGQVSVSDLGTGTQFSLWFPRMAADLAGAVEPAAPVGVNAEEPPEGHILIVEDVAQVRSIAARILRSAGFKTLTAQHGAEALDLLEQGHDVRLILSDLQMPVMGGRQLLEHLRARAEPGPPVVFMTGYSDDTHGQATDARMAPLAKPFTPEGLIEFVKNALA
jgi:two-component system cell cycle sensor histidine kinase/response regulator CckA